MNNLKYPIQLLGITLFCISLLSCGKDIPCDDATSTINFVTFPDIETDTIILKRFSKATNFFIPIDSFIITNTNSIYEKSNDTLQVRNSFGGDNGLKSTYDYEIYIPQTNRIFRISEITEEIRHINGGGLFSMDKKGCRNPIKSYKLNGQLISGEYNYLRIYIKR